MKISTMEYELTKISTDMIWILALLSTISLAVVGFFFPQWQILFIFLIILNGVTTSLLYWQGKIKDKMRKISDMKKITKEFEQFVHSNYQISLPYIIIDLMGNGKERFTKGTQNMEKTIKVWKYYFTLVQENFEKKFNKIDKLLDSRDALSNLNEILGVFADLIYEHYRYHEKFKEMVKDVGNLPSEDLVRYNKGVDKYNEFHRILYKFVIDYEQASLFPESFFRTLDKL